LVGLGRSPAQFLSPGDELVSYIEGIGELHQRFAPEGQAQDWAYSGLLSRLRLAVVPMDVVDA
jgi:hypothetical protein